MHSWEPVKPEQRQRLGAMPAAFSVQQPNLHLFFFFETASYITETSIPRATLGRRSWLGGESGLCSPWAASERSRRQWVQDMVGTGRSGHRRWWAQDVVGAGHGGHSMWWVQYVVGIEGGGCRRWWAQDTVGAEGGGHRTRWVQEAVGSGGDEHRRRWAQDVVGAGGGGHRMQRA